MASNENQGQALIPPNASSSSATLSVTEAHPKQAEGLGEKDAARPATRETQNCRQHILGSAAYWFNGAREAQSRGEFALACAYMENAYNHVENALAASNEALANLRGAIIDFKGHGMPGFTDRAVAYIVLQQAKKVLSLTGGKQGAPPVTQTPSMEGANKQ